MNPFFGIICFRIRAMASAAIINIGQTLCVDLESNQNEISEREITWATDGIYDV